MNNQNSRLTKSGIVILIFTIIFSFTFIIIGTVNLMDSNDDNPNVSGTYWVYNDVNKSVYVTEGKYYEFRFMPNLSGNYTIDIDGASISSITNSYGNSVNYDENYSYSYDNSYSTYLYSSDTYMIRVRATGDYISFIVSD